MPSSTVRALVDRALTGGGNEGIADDQSRDEIKATAMNELLRLAEVILNELTAPMAGERWSDRSCSDLRNQALFIVSQKLPHFQGETVSELRGWLRTILKNSRKNLIRYAASRRPTQGAVLPLESVFDDSQARTKACEPFSKELSVSRAIQIRMALDRLDPVDRRIVEMRYRDGLTVGQIAARVGRHERTVRRDLPRILALLRNDVEPPR